MNLEIAANLCANYEETNVVLEAMIPIRTYPASSRSFHEQLFRHTFRTNDD